MRTAVLVPVYNEVQNIKTLVERINGVSGEYTIVIVDDDSTDGTQDIVTRLKKKYRIEHYVRKNERGFGSALKFGLDKTKEFDIVVTMDADLSHDPAMIPLLEDAVKKGSDVVIGSRYVSGVRIADWSMGRRITSKITNLFVSLFLNTHLRDNSSGFRAYSRRAVNNLLPLITSEGYYVLEEIIFYANREKLRLMEVPIQFTDRKQGASKANIIKEAVGLLKLVVDLRLKKR